MFALTKYFSQITYKGAKSLDNQNAFIIRPSQYIDSTLMEG